MTFSLARLAGLGLVCLTACSSDDNDVLEPGDATPSRAHGLWQPGLFDTCTREQHDAYSVVGPDGKLYPTWHPPTGPGGCTFGHEHGRDPRDSDLHASAKGLPFGYANEVLALADPAHPRDEDHVGHKVEWENDLLLPVAGGGSSRCDLLVKLHQGTHSRDAFTNNLHELVYHVRCETGAELHVTMLAAIGIPGQFARACTQTSYIEAGSPTPSNSPTGFGARYIADRACVEEHMLVPDGRLSNYGPALAESWNTFNTVQAAGGAPIAFFNPWFRVELPSRYYDLARPSAVGRSLEVCYETGAEGERARGGACDLSTDSGALTDVTYDDPRSRFTGSSRSILINAIRLTNEGGPGIWYTDAFGANGRAEPFSGSIRQEIAAVNADVGVDFGSPSIGAGRVYAGPGVRSPN